MKFEMVHSNINVLDMDKSLAFYKKAFGLTEVRRKEREKFTIVYLGDGVGKFNLELTCLHDRKEPYDLSDNEIHLAFQTADYSAALAHHKEMGCVAYENEDMGIYFIEDPDGYWMEVVPVR